MVPIATNFFTPVFQDSCISCARHEILMEELSRVFTICSYPPKHSCNVDDQIRVCCRKKLSYDGHFGQVPLLLAGRKTWLQPRSWSLRAITWPRNPVPPVIQTLMFVQKVFISL
jgi:hypothetical protein